MRLVERVLEIQPGASARTSRETRIDDWYFQGHFPDNPVVPAVILVDLIAQTGGLAAGMSAAGEADVNQPLNGRVEAKSRAPLALRVAALGAFKFPAAAGCGERLETTARVVGRFGALFRIEGEVHANGRLVAAGSVTLATARKDG